MIAYILFQDDKQLGKAQTFMCVLSPTATDDVSESSLGEKGHWLCLPLTNLPDETLSGEVLVGMLQGHQLVHDGSAGK